MTPFIMNFHQINLKIGKVKFVFHMMPDLLLLQCHSWNSNISSKLHIQACFHYTITILRPLIIGSQRNN